MKLTNKKIKKKHHRLTIPESMREAEEGRLGKLAPFAAGGGHPLRPTSDARKGREKVFVGRGAEMMRDFILMEM